MSGRRTVTDPLGRFLSLDERAALRAPIEVASPFPNIAYTSQDYFDLEVERVFARSWVAVGFASSLPTFVFTRAFPCKRLVTLGS